MPNSASERVQKHRDALRAAGLRPLQIGVSDTSRLGFDDECRRQAALVARADAEDTELLEFMDATLSNVDGWKLNAAISSLSHFRENTENPGLR